jgi:hypothetical protein
MFRSCHEAVIAEQSADDKLLTEFVDTLRIVELNCTGLSEHCHPRLVYMTSCSLRVELKRLSVEFSPGTELTERLA